MVPVLSFVSMVVAIIISVIIPVLMCIIIKKKYNTSIKAFLLGCAGFFVFAGILESTINQIVLLVLPIGKTIQGNIYVYALYGGLAAGIFEETARFLIMKFLLKKEYKNPFNSIMYGAGHGGFEVMFLIGTGMLNNIIYSVLINTNQISVITATLPAEQQEQFELVINQLIELKPYEYFVGFIERIPAVAIHIALSVIVWIAVTKKKTWLYPVAIILHALVDAVFLIIGNQIKDMGLNSLLVEPFVYICAIILCVFAVILWKKNKMKEIDISENVINESK